MWYWIFRAFFKQSTLVSLINVTLVKGPKWYSSFQWFRGEAVWLCDCSWKLCNCRASICYSSGMVVFFIANEINTIHKITHVVHAKLNTAEVHLASFLSGRFTTMAVINLPEKKLAKHTSVHCQISRNILSRSKTS